MSEQTTLADVADRVLPSSLPAVRLAEHRCGIVLGRNDTGQYVEIGTGGIVIPHPPTTPAELITDPAQRASALTDAFASTRATYLNLVQRLHQVQHDLAAARNESILRDIELQQFLAGLVAAGRLDWTEAQNVLTAQLTPLPPPRLRVTVAVEGTFDIESIPDPDGVPMAAFGDLLTADISRIRNTLTGVDRFQIAPGRGLHLTVTTVEPIAEPDHLTTNL